MLSNIPKPILKNQISVFTPNGQTEPPPRKLLDRVRDAIRVKHYSYQTEKSYVQWVRRFILFHNKRHPSEMGGDEVNAFLTFSNR
nr:phage integrase N-terminal SAM-like domain-containing protein [Pseudanabaena cinerea]